MYFDVKLLGAAMTTTYHLYRSSLIGGLPGFLYPYFMRDLVT